MHASRERPPSTASFAHSLRASFSSSYITSLILHAALWSLSLDERKKKKFNLPVQRLGREQSTTHIVNSTPILSLGLCAWGNRKNFSCLRGVHKQTDKNLKSTFLYASRLHGECTYSFCRSRLVIICLWASDLFLYKSKNSNFKVINYRSVDYICPLPSVCERFVLPLHTIYIYALCCWLPENGNQ